MTTAAASAPEAWLRGPLPGIGPGLMPAAHALVQAREDLTRAASNATTEELWAAEHASRHTGQLITTLKVVRGLRAGSGA